MYSIRISQFEGPLDLLLSLIYKAEISIEDIFVSDVTDQYLRYIENAETDDMEYLSDFLTMASTLVFIKSRSLLPDNTVCDESEVDPEAELIEKLKLYKIYKDACEDLRQLESDAEKAVFKMPEEIPGLVSPIIWEENDADVLYKAFLNVLSEKKEKKLLFEKVAVRKDSFSVKVQADKILRLLKVRHEIRFSDIFSDLAHPVEIAVTFLAVLQLWHDKRIDAVQSCPFATINIKESEK